MGSSDETTISRRLPRLCSFESRRHEEMRQLIEKQGGIATVAPSMREVPLDDNPAAFEFAEELLAGRVDVVVFLTGVGARALLEVLETRHPREAVALLRHLASDAVQREWSRHGHLSAIRAAAPGAEAPAGQRRLLQFLEEARATALAPDVGFDLEVSDAFLDAVSLVLAGRETPAAALAAAEAQVRALRRIPPAPNGPPRNNVPP